MGVLGVLRGVARVLGASPGMVPTLCMPTATSASPSGVREETQPWVGGRWGSGFVSPTEAAWFGCPSGSYSTSWQRALVPAQARLPVPASQRFQSCA